MLCRAIVSLLGPIPCNHGVSFQCCQGFQIPDDLPGGLGILDLGSGAGPDIAVDADYKKIIFCYLWVAGATPDFNICLLPSQEGLNAPFLPEK